MTLNARVVLQDCRDAINELNNDIQGSVWRRKWTTAVILLRTIGHVLESVDSKISAHHKVAIEEAHKQINNSKHDNLIFFEFIKKERDLIVKEYKTSAGQGVTVYVGFGDNKSTVVNHYLINSGPFEGQDQRDVLREAVKWWEEYLDNVDQAVSK